MKFFSHYKYFKELYNSLIFLFLLLFIGSAGYYQLEDYTVLESLYMTIITVSTVGFGEVRPLTDEGKFFTAALIIFSFSTFAYAASSIARYILDGKLRAYYNFYKMNTKIDQLQGHVIVCGYGRNGRQAVDTLKSFKKQFVVIEFTEEPLERLKGHEDCLYVIGDATDEHKLLEAGINRASAIITTLPKDSDNVFVVLTARELNKNLTIISRASEESTDKKLRIAGANNVIMPDRVGGAQMATLVVKPDVNEFLDKITIYGESKVNLEELLFESLPDEVAGCSIKELENRFKTGVRIIGYKDPQGEYCINPSPELKLVPHTKLFVLGTPDQIIKLNNALGKH